MSSRYLKVVPTIVLLDISAAPILVWIGLFSGKSSRPFGPPHATIEPMGADVNRP